MTTPRHAGHATAAQLRPAGARTTEQTPTGTATPHLPEQVVKLGTAPGDSTLMLGSDLLLWVNHERGVWTVWAVNGDGEPLVALAKLATDPDGATLTLLADMARRTFPTHASLVDQDA